MHERAYEENIMNEIEKSTKYFFFSLSLHKIINPQKSTKKYNSFIGNYATKLWVEILCFNLFFYDDLIAVF